MSCFTAWNELEKVTKIAFIFHWISFALYIVGFATPVWITGRIPFHVLNHDEEVINTVTVNAFGLWQDCSNEYGCLQLVNSENFGGKFI